jgi:2-hydroxy-6-oxonona-2,4-dienedioate hydrolase
MKNTFTSTRRPRTAVASRSDVADLCVDVAGVRTRYVESGKWHGGVPLVVLHGYNGSCDYFFPHTVPLLAEGRHVIAPDLPGCGLSDTLPSHTLDSYVQFVVDFLDELRIERADLMGHSMGGLIAIVAAAYHPERVRKLVLVDSAGLPELITPKWLAPFKMLTDSSLRQVGLYPMFVKIGMRARARREGLQMIQTESVSRYLRSLAVPTLVVWGSRDRVVPLEHGAIMARNIPGARLAIIRGAGHMPFYDKPEQCASLILGFLKRET